MWMLFSKNISGAESYLETIFSCLWADKILSQLKYLQRTWTFMFVSTTQIRPTMDRLLESTLLRFCPSLSADLIRWSWLFGHPHLVPIYMSQFTRRTELIKGTRRFPLRKLGSNYSDLRGQPGVYKPEIWKIRKRMRCVCVWEDNKQ